MFSGDQNIVDELTIVTSDLSMLVDDGANVAGDGDDGAKLDIAAAERDLQAANLEDLAAVEGEAVGDATDATDSSGADDKSQGKAAANDEDPHAVASDMLTPGSVLLRVFVPRFPILHVNFDYVYI